MRSSDRSVLLAFLILGAVTVRGGQLAPTTAEAGAPTSQPADAKPESPFWQGPKIKFEQKLVPADVQLTSPPEERLGFAFVQPGNVEPRTFFVGNQKSLPYIVGDASYGIVAGGMKAGATIYGDRKYAIQKMPPELAGLTLLQTKMAHKGVVDARFAIAITAASPCYVLVAIDERALAIFDRIGAPAWLGEYSPTGYRIETDDPLMADANAGYLVFARKAPAGRIVLGAPCMDVDTNAMYFVFFAEAK